MAHFYWPLVFPIVSFCLSFPCRFLQLHSNLPCNAPTLQCRWSLLAYLTPIALTVTFLGQSTKHATKQSMEHTLVRNLLCVNVHTKHKIQNTKHATKQNGAHSSTQPAVCQCPHKMTGKTATLTTVNSTHGRSVFFFWTKPEHQICVPSITLSECCRKVLDIGHSRE